MCHWCASASCAHEQVQVFISGGTCMWKLYVYDRYFQAQPFTLAFQAWSLSVPDANWFRNVSKFHRVPSISSSPELGLYMCTTAFCLFWESKPKTPHLQALYPLKHLSGHCLKKLHACDEPDLSWTNTTNWSSWILRNI